MKNLKQFAVAICVAASLFATLQVLAYGQDHPNAKSAAKQDAKTTDVKNQLTEASKKGFALATKTNVSQSASIQAVLIPARLARRIFGREVSNNYAVVEVIVSNDDEKAALVVHSVFLDYSQWLLSGMPSTTPAPPTPETSQVFNKASQVASIESRLVRGEMIDAQQWTARNWTIRSLTAVGSIAGGFAFPFSGDVAKGIAAFNGEVVPGAANLWPDGTVNQINRVTDFGFQTNKVIPKQASDILVAFFPIERFLTPGFKKVFLDDPAALFVSSEMLADPKTTKTFMDFVQPWAGQILPEMSKTGQISKADKQNFQALALQAMMEHCSPQKSAGDESGAKGANAGSAQATNQNAPEPSTRCKLQEILKGISLNNIRVGLEGAMTVDVNTIPATIYGVKFDSGNTDTSIWTNINADQAGTISGVYLTGGDPEAVDGNGAKYSAITITKVTDGSSDTELHFTMKISKCIPPDSKIYFVVNKSTTQDEKQSAAKPTNKNAPKAAKDSKDSVASTPYEFPLPGYTCPASANENGSTADGTKGDEGATKDNADGSKTATDTTPAPSTPTSSLKGNRGSEGSKKK